MSTLKKVGIAAIAVIVIAAVAGAYVTTKA